MQIFGNKLLGTQFYLSFSLKYVILKLYKETEAEPFFPTTQWKSQWINRYVKATELAKGRCLMRRNDRKNDTGVIFVDVWSVSSLASFVGLFVRCSGHCSFLPSFVLSFFVSYFFRLFVRWFAYSLVLSFVCSFFVSLLLPSYVCLFVFSFACLLFVFNITFENSPSSRVFRWGYVNTEEVLYCFYKINLKTMRQSKTWQSCLHNLT